jgi:alkylation response protein AidB-like acyl-CoA dehydrogenase
VDVACTLAETATLGRVLFDRAMSAEQRARFIPDFLEYDDYQLAHAQRESGADTTLAPRYHRPGGPDSTPKTTATREGNDCVIDGVKSLVLNAPLARLFAVTVRTDSGEVGTALVPADTAGITVREPQGNRGCYHGVCGDVAFTRCRVPAANLLGAGGTAALRGVGEGTLKAAMNVGVGRAAYKRRSITQSFACRAAGASSSTRRSTRCSRNARYGFRPRNAVWQAAWALDHPQAVEERFRIGKIVNKSGWRFYQNGELIFESARLPHANILGEVNGAHKARSKGGAEFNDFELAANALGVCDDACEAAMMFAKTRSQGGKPLFDQQVVQLKLGEMHMLTEALRSFVMRLAGEMDASAHSLANVVFLMNFSCDVIQKVTNLNMDIHGATGEPIDEHTDKLVRDAIIWTHLGGDASQRLKVMRRMKTASIATDPA